MARDPHADRMSRLELKLDNMARALGSQAKLTAELRSAHNRSLQVLADVFNHSDTEQISTVLASLEHDPNRPD